jgi:hypothetical protein
VSQVACIEGLVFESGRTIKPNWRRLWRDMHGCVRQHLTPAITSVKVHVGLDHLCVGTRASRLATAR